MIRVALHTFGCRTNQADSASIRSELERGDETVSFVAWGQPADVVVVNTCTVTARADRDGRKRIRQVSRMADPAPVVVLGCYAEADAGTLAQLPGVVAVLGNRHRGEAAATIVQAARRALDPAAPRVRVGGMDRARQVETHRIDRFAGRVRAMLKIQEGCDRRCSYCIVPDVRGPSRSVPASQVVDDARRLAVAGHPEIVLTGTHTGGWGREQIPRSDLGSLLGRLLDEVPGVRFRISSVDPEEVDEALLERLGDERVCRHLHLALQHGDAGVLRAMRRASTPATIRRAAERVVARVPGIALGADVIAGYPTEDDRAHERGRALLEELPLAYLHVFGFSPRPGTPAAALQRLPRGAVAARVAGLRALSEELLRPRFLRTLVGRTVEVAVEHDDGAGTLRGTSSEFATVELAGGPADVARLVPARVDRIAGTVCRATRIAVPGGASARMIS